MARARIRDGQVQFLQAELMRPWPCADAVAELVTCKLVLEHIKDMGAVFREAARALTPGELFFVSDLQPCRQYLGSQARFVETQGETTKIQAFVHHVSDFTRAAHETGFQIEQLDEWWGEDDAQKAPRLLTLLLK